MGTPPLATMVIQWLVPYGKSRPMTDLLHRFAAQARTDASCCLCSVSAEVHHKTVIRYVEAWKSEEALRRQFDTERFRAILALIDDPDDDAVIEFDLPDGPRGFDYIPKRISR